ncbi:hypothetical protein DFJ74DRAFT_697612 [Hyaloraphidium curvatum]|nr:hypothetical protein DFJ74DRAFT_697612 [Hyaloraphidium curvatum]
MPAASAPAPPGTPPMALDAPAHPAVLNIQGWHFGRHHSLAVPSARSPSPDKRSGAGSPGDSPTLGPASDRGSLSDAGTEAEVDRELARAVVEGFLGKRVEVDVAGKRLNPLSLPTILLYDKVGLEIFDEITYLDEYYLTNAEMEILKQQGDEIIKAALGGAGDEHGVAMVELGCGSMRKTRYLLEHLAAHPNSSRCTYFAVDLDHDTLAATVSEMAAAFPTLNFVGLNGTYDDALEFVRSGGLDAPGLDGLPARAGTSGPVRRKRCLMWFGSSIGNFGREDAAGFVRKWTQECLQPGDKWFVGIDRRNDKAKIELAYNDPKQVTARFCLNGLVHADRLLRSLCPTEAPIVDVNDFAYFSQYDAVRGRHEAFFRCVKKGGLQITFPASLIKELWNADAPEDPVRTHTSDDFAGGDTTVSIAEGELVHIEFSFKYSEAEVARLLHHAELAPAHKWTDPLDQFDLHAFSKPPVFFDKAATLPGGSVPSLAEWDALWTAWETVTERMIPADRVLERPIALRHPFVFYLGHIPGFLDIMVDKAMKWGLMEPAYYADIFERGIDPDMDDPTKCHPHSLVPDVWPPRHEILEYKGRVRARIEALCAAHERAVAEGVDEVDGTRIPKELGRALWMAYEHQAMHLETIIYMLVQSPNIAAPIDIVPVPMPRHKELVVPSEAAMVSLPGGTFMRGIPFSVDPAGNLLGWDNESPAHEVTVAPFKMQERPVTNVEYLAFLDSVLPQGWRTQSPLDELVPSSWHVAEDGSISVKTALGRLPMLTAQHWPLFGSCAQGEAYAASKGMRLATEDEMAFAIKTEGKQAGEGMCEANVGFALWHPSDVVSVGPSDGKLKHVLGHGWEWTSTTFAPFDGFVSDAMYPGYSSDFFDGKHNTILGGSWATVPMIAGRESFRNWYQKTYPFVFCKFRCAL